MISLALTKKIALFFFSVVPAVGVLGQTQLTVQGAATTTATSPDTYNSSLQYQLKHYSVSGLPNTGYGYHSLLGLRPNSDYGLGKAHELAFTDDNQVFLRSGYSAWEGWRRMVQEDETGNAKLNGQLTFPMYTGYISLGSDAVYPYGYAAIGHGSGKGALIYHHQYNSGPTLKVDIDGYNFAPAVYVSGANAYLNGGLFSVDYTHLNYAYVSAAYKANMTMTSPSPGGAVVGFQGDLSTINGEAYGGRFTANAAGTGNAYGLYVDAYKGDGATGSAYGVFVRRGKSFFQDYVGIGTGEPAVKLDAVGTIRATGVTYPGSGAGVEIFYNNATGNILAFDRNAAKFKPLSLNDMVMIHDDGNVTIGTLVPHNDARLAVNGNVVATKVKVTQSGWPDYVFQSHYILPTLKEVEGFINENGHLPGVSSAREIETKGLDLGDNQAALLKKIEELTLYVIDLKKQLDRQQKEINQLTKQTAQNR